MAERDIKGTWKGKARGVTKSSSPMIGCIYEGQDKFFGKRTIGMLVEMFDQNDEAVLRTIENKLVSVVKQSLKVLV